MACPQLEDLLVDYSELPAAGRAAVDAHLVACGDCRAFYDALGGIDDALAAAFAPAAVGPGLGAAVRRRTLEAGPARRPSWIPEILDFIGWAAVVGVALYVVDDVSPVAQMDAYTAWAAGGVIFSAGLWVGLRCSAAMDGGHRG
jgi:anti-sigma factor RsiW